MPDDRPENPVAVTPMRPEMMEELDGVLDATPAPPGFVEENSEIR